MWRYLYLCVPFFMFVFIIFMMLSFGDVGTKVFFSGIGIYFSIQIGFFLAYLIGWPIAVYYRIKLFSIHFGDDTISVKQGIISRTYTDLPYQKIQNVFIERDLWDRILGTSRVIIDNFGMGNNKGSLAVWQNNIYPGTKQYAFITPGVKGERLFLPGLLPKDSERIKVFILNKQKEISQVNIAKMH